MSVEKSHSESVKVKVIDLGTISYVRGYELQEHYHQKVRDGELAGVILMLEHNPVLTLGKHSDPSMILATDSELKESHVDRVNTDRGGEVTAHMPGQLVIYPILPLVKLGLQARAYVNALMQAVIETLAVWDIKARCDSQYPGVWVENRKICAVGVRIRERVSLHGIALNVNNSLDLFERIVPCGISHLGVTSMAKELGRTIVMEQLRVELLERLDRRLGVPLDLESRLSPTESAPRDCQV
ncbi:MAG: lipoyl(octanoyl) transferase LipB [Chitinophagaceae bacterium]|nr:lipoyl(octanoyl) transferase LipB [Oligoflexus sp.]